MRFVFLNISALIIFSTFANAEPVQKAASSTAKTAPEIVIDKERGIIRFMVDGREVAVINKDGLLVKGDIAYSGGLTDLGGNHAK
jgi:hypothetical protein